MKKLLFLILLSLVSAAGGLAQSSNICFDTTFTGTGRKQLAVPGGGLGTADRYSTETFAYKLSGSPSGVSITVEAADSPLPTTPATICSATTTTTNATTIPMCGGATQTQTYRYWYANLGTFTGGSSPTLTVTSCMSPNIVPGGTAGALSWSGLTAPTADLTMNMGTKNTTMTNGGTFNLGFNHFIMSSTDASSLSLAHLINTTVQGPFFDYHSAVNRWAFGISSGGNFDLRNSNLATDPVNGTTLFRADTTGDWNFTGAINPCNPSGGSGTAYTCTLDLNFAPQTGTRLTFTPDVDSGASPTLAVNGAAAAGIFRSGGQLAVGAKDLKANKPIVLTFDAAGHWDVAELNSSSLTLNGTTSGSTTLSATATGGTLNLGSTNATVTSGGALTVTGCTGCGGGMAIGGTVTSGTAGSIPFIATGPVLAQDNANLKWDASVPTLLTGAGTTGVVKAHVGPAGQINGVVEINSVDDMANLSATQPGSPATLSLKATESDPASDTFYGLHDVLTSTTASGALTTITGVYNQVSQTGNGDVSNILGHDDQMNVSGSGTLSFLSNFNSHLTVSNATITEYNALDVHPVTLNSGTIVSRAALNIGVQQNTGGTNNYGIIIDNITASTNNYAIKTGLGEVNFGDVLHLSRGFTVAAGANTLPTPTVGMVARVTDSLNPVIGSTVSSGGSAAALVWYNGANWTVIGK